MSRIHTNIPAVRAIHRLAHNQADLELRLERLATGLRVNRGADDPAGLIASERLRSDIRVIQQAIENSSRAFNVISTAEGALNEASALLLDLQSLVLAAANEAGLTDAEVAANQLQIDSVLDSLDRIANTTSFAGQKLLDGSRAYLTSGIPPTALDSVQLFAARVPHMGSRTVTVKVTQSAQTARISFLGASGSPATTSATTVELRGMLGVDLLSFASGTTLAEIRTAINASTAVTGVSAIVSSTGVASALVLDSTELGSDAFVSVSPISGNFVSAGNNNSVIRDTGVDAGVLIDGQNTSVKGVRADVRSGGLDARLYLTRSFAQTLSSATFSITGGGSIFQITPEISPNGQVPVGLNSITTTQLGNAVVGRLYSLRSGAGNHLESKNFQTAQEIIAEAIDQVSSYRGRLGNIQKNVIEPNINSQGVALENVTASESVIRDADMAEEVAALTRAQVLVQSTQATLRIANTVPHQILALLS